jgi:cytochrome c biogenesis protein CcmG/thiol:disulfide interchange protein DsbE
MEIEQRLPDSTSRDETPAEKGTAGRRRSVRKRRIVVFLLVILLSASFLALLGSQVLTPAQNQGQAGDTSPLIGHPAPDFTLAVLSTHASPALHLASLKGKPVMLNFWASWCDVCKAEAPLLQNAWQRVQSQGIVFVGIDIQDTRSDGLSFLQTYGITYPNVVGASGSVTINYGVTGVPETFFLNRQGVIVKKVIGELTEQTLQSNLQLISR